MRTVWILTLLALSVIGLSGCNSCRCGLFGRWFHRHDCCPPPCALNTNATQRYAARPQVADDARPEVAVESVR